VYVNCCKLKVKPINLDVWYKYQPISKTVTSDNNISRSNVTTRCKAKPMEPNNNKIKRIYNGEQHTKDLFTPFGLIMTYIWRREIFPLHYQRVPYEEMQKVTRN